MEIYYFTKPNKSQWKGDDNGALSKALELADFIKPEPLNKVLIKEKEHKIKGKIVVKGTNIDDLLKLIKENKDQFDLDRITFIVGGNQTDKTSKFINEIRELNKECKIEADFMPSTLDKELQAKVTDDNTTINISFDAITGTTPINVYKKFKNEHTRELLSLEQNFAEKQNTSFVTIHWGGAVGGKAISDDEHELHKNELVTKLKEITKEHSQLQIIFVPHGGRSFLPQENSSTNKEKRKQEFISALGANFGETNLHADLNYNVALEFTRKHQKHCIGIVTTAENLSTIAEQLSILDPKAVQKPPVDIFLFPCCEHNNKSWLESDPNYFKESWLSNAQSIHLHGAKGLKKSTEFEEMTTPTNQNQITTPTKQYRKSGVNQGRGSAVKM